MRKVFILLAGFVLAITNFRCKSDEETLFQLKDSAQTGINFINKLNLADSLSVLEFEYMFNGGGVALIDINNDGLQDIFFTANMVSCRLYLNKGNLHFEDITQKAGVATTGWCYGAAVVDINQDGYPDIYVCKAGSRKTKPEDMHNIFFINNGNGTFTDKAKEMGLDDDGYDIQAAFLDYDKDGDLDMYMLRNAFVNYNRNNARAKDMNSGGNSVGKLFRNNGKASSGNITFTDVSREAGITIEGFGLGVNVCDLNDDSYPDVYVSNDFLTNDLVWMNNGNGTFTNKADTLLRHTSYNAMGNDVADFNNDGKPDITEVDMLPPDNKRWKLTMMGNTYDEFHQDVDMGYQPQYVRNSLQLNNGDGTFSEIGQMAGIYATEWSWSPLFADYDNDGWKDLFISNGYRQDVTNLDFVLYGKRTLFMGTPDANRKDRLDMLNQFAGIHVANYLYKNNGDLTFTNEAQNWGLNQESYANGAVYGDLDNDGDLDLVINNLDEPASVYESKLSQMQPQKKWLSVQFSGKEGNREGLGTKVYLWQNGKMQYAYFSPYRGYLSTVEHALHFGLNEKPADSLLVQWADGKTEMIQHPPADTTLTVSYANATFNSHINSSFAKQNLFVNAESSTGINYTHEEDNFVDFKLQPLLPHMHSHAGPGLAVADINGDGLDDVYAGAAATYKGNLFLQNPNGSFTEQAMPDSNIADNMGALFFDADGDGDNDLFVASGGVNEHKEGNPVYQDKLYINDGKGNFSVNTSALPAMNASGASVVASDYDHDGDLDLFVCGRVCPGDYPLTPKSFLLRNDSKNGNYRFTDVSAAQLPGKGKIGMITSALWSDYDNDGWTDLVLCGEFMPLTFIKNEKGTLSKEAVTIEHSSGWWNSLVAGDFDKDGDIDYIAGNLGLNSPYKASPEEPVCIYAKDYDKNGRLDPVMCHFQDGNEYIVHSRDDINRQMTAMRGRFKDYISYATITFPQAFRTDELSDAFVVKSETFRSSYIENAGNGKFAVHALPAAAQFSPVNAMLCEDFNNDGNLDILCTGNDYSTEVQTGNYDAQGSLLLYGNGKGKFTPDRTALDASGDNKSVVRLFTSAGSSVVLIGANSGKMKVLSVKEPSSKIIDITPDDTYAIITNKDGSKYRQELYFGNSYLSQSSRRIRATGAMKSITIYTNKGTSRNFSL